MVYAHRFRLRLLQKDVEYDVFGPDVIINVLIIASIPLLAYSVGKESITSIYLLSAFLSFLFYKRSHKQELTNMTQSKSKQENNYLYFAIPFLILFPLFFQLSSGIFDNPRMYFNSGGVLVNLPIPIAVITCFIGIWVLGKFRQSYLSFGVIFLTLALMVLTSILSTDGQLVEQKAKLILMIQFVLPMFALVLGQMYASTNEAGMKSHLSKAFLSVLILIIPVQLLFSIGNGHKILSPDMGFFSIYQHLQYTPVIFVAAFLISYFDLWDKYRNKTILAVMACLFGVYVAASASMLAIGLLFIGLSVFAIFSLYSRRKSSPLILLLIVLIASLGYFQLEKERLGFKFGFMKNHATSHANSQDMSELEQIAPNVAHRIEYWKFYYANATSSVETFFLGNPTPPDRKKFPSAHNYYLDFVFNFGLLALLPMLTLIFITIRKALQNWKLIIKSPQSLSLVMVGLFLILIDNSLKVGLRQPFPGIFTFYLWGILLAHLYNLSPANASNSKVIG